MMKETLMAFNGDAPEIDVRDGKKVWAWPDGTVLPYVAGGSDAGLLNQPPAGDQTLNGGLQFPQQQTGQQPPPMSTVPFAPGQRVFTEDEINRARSEERDKLYRDREVERQELAALRAEKEARDAQDQAATVAAQAQADSERRAKEIEELDSKTLIERRDQEWNQKLAEQRDEFQRELAHRDALLAKESEYQQLQTYKAQAIAANAEMILPELTQWVNGNTRDEVDQSIARAIETSSSVLTNLNQARTEAVRHAPGVPATAPAMGPEAFVGGQRNYTPEQLAALSMSEYAQIRQHLPTGRSNGGDRGIFG